jgi:hypothetical protein
MGSKGVDGRGHNKQHQDSPNIFLKHSGTLKRNTIKRYYIAIHCNPSLYINKAGLLPTVYVHSISSHNCVRALSILSKPFIILYMLNVMGIFTLKVDPKGEEDDTIECIRPIPKALNCTVHMHSRTWWNDDLVCHLRYVYGIHTISVRISCSVANVQRL